MPMVVRPCSRATSMARSTLIELPLEHEDSLRSTGSGEGRWIEDDQVVALLLTLSSLIEIKDIRTKEAVISGV